MNVRCVTCKQFANFYRQGDAVMRGWTDAGAGNSSFMVCPTCTKKRAKPAEVSLPLFQHPQPETEEAIERAAAHERAVRWIEAALTLVWRIASQSARFTGDDVWEAIENDPLMKIHNAAGHVAPGALGAVFRRADKEKWIELEAGVYVESRRPSMHRKPMRVWRSLIYQGSK